MARAKANEYKCAACGKIFESDWADDEAAAELNETFGALVEDCNIVCDDCYRKMGFGG